MPTAAEWVAHPQSTVEEFSVPGYSPLDTIINERNALRERVVDLLSRLDAVIRQRDAMREQNAALLEVLNCYALGKKTCGHGFVCICNQVKAEELIAKIEGHEINPWWRDSPEK